MKKIPRYDFQKISLVFFKRQIRKVQMSTTEQTFQVRVRKNLLYHHASGDATQLTEVPVVFYLASYLGMVSMLISFFTLAIVFGSDAMDVPLSEQKGRTKTLYGFGVILQSLGLVILVTMLHTGTRLDIQGAISLILSTGGMMMLVMSIISFQTRKDIEEEKLTGDNSVIGSVAGKALNSVLQ